MSIEWLTCQPRHWPRYGDGNWLVGVQRGKNCDGHRMCIKGMAAAVRKTVKEPKDGIDYALTREAIERCSEQICAYASDKISWTNGDILSDALIQGKMGQFTAWMAERNTRMAWVGPPHIGEVPKKIRGMMHLRMRKDCWKDTDMVVDTLRDWADKIDVVLFAASFLTCCAIYALHEAFEGKWMIDVGAAFDPLCGVISRDYQEKIDDYTNRYQV